MLKPITDLDALSIAPTAPMRAALDIVNRNRRGIALVLDEHRRLLGTLTDGDFRRAILAGDSLDTPVSAILEKKPLHRPVTASIHADQATLLICLRENKIRQLPLLDAEDRVVGLVTLDELLPEEALPLQAVVMAGGFGTRLQPLTNDLPKPMLPLGDKPLLEHIVEQLQQSGIHHLKLTTHYLPEKIREHFGDGGRFGLDIQYLNEDEPRGTAGALSLLGAAEDDPVLLMNGDILTRVDFRAMLAFHREHHAELTVGVRQYDFKVPYGVVDCVGADVRKVDEKPVFNFLVNAGVYLIEPSAHRKIPKDVRFDMTDLIQELTASGARVVAFPIVEYWLDIGQHADYTKAQEDMKTWKEAR